ncbi:MAG: trimethylamine methyltransferase family protein [Anaerolineae bacterium]
MNQDPFVRPKLTVLDPIQIEQVHGYSLQILSTVGVRVDSERARRLLVSAGGEQPAGSHHVRLPRALVERALQTAPASVQIYNRLGTPAFDLPGEARFGIGVTALYYQDPETDNVTPFARQHMADLVRLGHNLPSFDAISTVGVIQDMAPDVADLYAVLEMTANTTKPLIILISDENRFPDALNLLEHLHGDLATRPAVIPYFNPITPLVINEGTSDKMMAAIERDIPFIYSSYGMAGASTPITPGGALAMLNAELLAGLTLSQVIKAGTPVILGILPAFFDMKGMGSFYDMASYVLDLACAEMMAHYHLPHSGTSGSGMGWGVDLITAGNQWLNHIVSCLGSVGLVPFVGDILTSLVFSPAVIVYADEIIAQARRLAQGFLLDDSTVSIEEIAQVGPGGSFLMSDLTLKHFRQAYFHSEIFAQWSLDEWQAQGQPRAEMLVRRRTRHLLATSSPPDDHAEVLARGTDFIQSITGQ